MAHTPLAFMFGILGNLSSFVCFLAPLPTFYRVCKKKSTEGFQSVPYVAALFSAMLWIFYAYVKTGETLLITINAFGCVIETIYLAIYVAYSPKKARMFTLRLILLINFGGFCVIALLTHFLHKGPLRIKVLGWICVVFATSVFAAPLSIIRVVIKTKSVEFLPLPLSFLLTVSAVMWLLYGIALKDIYVAFPNIVGLTFGMVQMVLYAMYRKNKPMKDQKLPEHKGDVINENEGTEEEKQEAVNIEIGEKEKHEQQDGGGQEEQPQKKQDQVGPHDQTQHNDNNNNNKTGEACIEVVQKESCEV